MIKTYKPNKSKKPIFKALMLLMIFTLLLFTISEFFFPYDIHHDKWRLYYGTPKQSVEVIHFGSSHSIRTFVPSVESEVLHADVISMGCAGLNIEQIKYMLIEAYKTQTPKVVALELFSFDENNREAVNKGRIHRAFDKMHLSKNKIDGINYNVIKENKLEYFIPISSYHLRWKKEGFLNEVWHALNKDHEKHYFGFEPFTSFLRVSESTCITPPETLTDQFRFLPQERMDVLRDIVNICESHGSQVVFVVAPFVEQFGFSNVEIQEYINGLTGFIKEHDIEVINYCNMAESIDLNMSVLSDYGHVNLEGAIMVSMHFANYIKTEYADLFADSIWENEAAYREDYQAVMQSYNEFLRIKDVFKADDFERFQEAYTKIPNLKVN